MEVVGHSVIYNPGKVLFLLSQPQSARTKCACIHTSVFKMLLLEYFKLCMADIVLFLLVSESAKDMEVRHKGWPLREQTMESLEISGPGETR